MLPEDAKSSLKASGCQMSNSMSTLKKIPSVGSILLYFLRGELAGVLAKRILEQDNASCWYTCYTMCSISVEIKVSWHS